MLHRVHNSPNLIYSIGTQVVVTRTLPVAGARSMCPAGAVGEVVAAPQDREHSYRIRLLDGAEVVAPHEHLQLLAEYKQGSINRYAGVLDQHGLFDRVILRCVIGSRAYGLDREGSDTDRRSVYLPPAALHWSLYGVPEQLENESTQEAYWELQKFTILALKANPNVLECLYTPLIDTATPLALDLLQQREIFLSKLVYQTYNGYVMSQFKKMQADGSTSCISFDCSMQASRCCAKGLFPYMSASSATCC
jgi:hypothetical protein